MAADNGPVTGCSKSHAVIRDFAALCICAVLAASCGRQPSPAFRATATTILNSMDESIEKLRGFQEQIQQGNGGDEVGKNPAFLMYREAVDELHIFNVRIRLNQGEAHKKHRADADAEKRLGTVRDTYRDCVVVLFTEVDDELPDSGINRLFKDVPAYSEEIIDALGGRLGVEAHTMPPGESCALYAKRASDFRRDYNLNP